MAIKKLIKLIINPYQSFCRVICLCRSLILTRLYVDKGKGKIVIQSPFLKVKIKKAKGAIFELNENLSIGSWLKGLTPVNICLSTNAKFVLNGSFSIGNGVTISISKDAELIIGGKEEESSSGITCNTLIMVYKRIEIGKDFICAWDVTITDSDWHKIIGQEHSSPVFIGNHVWVAHNSSILKGSYIGNNSIIASHSKVTNKRFPDNVLVVGTQGKIAKENILWQRDI